MKNYLLKIIGVFVMSLLSTIAVNAQNKKIVYIADGTKTIDSSIMAHPETKITDFITGIGGYDVHMMTNPNVLAMSQVQKDSLINVDLIVIGRGIGSANFNGHQDSIWNKLTTPVLSLNMFAVRSSTLKWFDTTNPDYGGTVASKNVKINVPGDAVFQGLTLLAGDSLEFWNGMWNSLMAGAAGNETILASFTGADAVLRIVYARFNPGVAFYALGAPLAWTDHIPKGYRTFMGMGADKSGGNPYNYFGFSFDSQEVFKKEIARLIALGKPTGIIAKISLIANVYPTSAVNYVVVEMAKLKEVNIIDITGKLVLSAKAKGQELNVNVSNLKPGVYFVKAIDSNNKSVVKRIIKK